MDIMALVLSVLSYAIMYLMLISVYLTDKLFMMCARLIRTI